MVESAGICIISEIDLGVHYPKGGSAAIVLIPSYLDAGTLELITMC